MGPRSSSRRIVVFGTGECGRRVLAALRRGVAAIAASDNNEKLWRQQVSGVPIVPPADIPTLSYDYVVVCSRWAAEIVPSLVTLGIAPERILSCYEVAGDDRRHRRELSILNDIVDVAAAGLPSVSGQSTAESKAPASGVRRILAECRGALRAWRNPRAWYPLFCRLPVNRRIAFFDSYWGKAYSCNPRAISEYLEHAPDGTRWTLVWGLSDPAAVTTPGSVIKVKRLGLAYHYYAARAGLLVSNVNFPDHIVKRPGTIQLQTMHGTPIKTLGLDIPDEFKTKRSRAAFLERCAKWDYLTAPGQYTADVAARAFQFERTTLPFGYPRNDYLFSGNTAAEIARLRESLGIPDSRHVILFAPTWRPTGDNAVSESTRAVLTCFLNDPVLSQQYVLLVRFHHLMHESPLQHGDAAPGSVIDVSNHPDNRELMLIADALITDYSSIVFDYALLERPIVLCCLDYRRYAQETRGVYMDIVQESPWPVYQTTAELAARLHADVSRPIDLPSHRRFVAKYGEWEHGTACKRLYDEVLQPWVTTTGVSAIGRAA
jgi:CDP-glycerol glycerophosphotransferase